ncbi:MAG: acyltransferase [Rhizobiales bacterium]|nr:acyltransferase [Hyphomicrobiales bacterium]
MSQAVPLRSIQILRALAAGLVVFGHSLHETQYVAAKTAQLPLTASLLDWGIGVDIFFVVSGFIMVYTSTEFFGQPNAARVFLMRRIVRVVPLYWLITAGLILVYFIAPRALNVPIEGWRSIVESFLFIPGMRANGEMRPIMALGWTLNYEMFFYVVFACCLLLPLKRAMVCLIAFFVSISIFGAIVTMPTKALTFWTDSIVLEFIFGASIAFACRAKLNLSLGAALCLISAGVVLSIALGPLWDVDQFLPRFIAGGLPAAILVAGAAFGPRLAASWLVSPLVLLGDASYSLYLTHPFVIRPLRNVWMAFGTSLPLGLYVIVCALAAIAAAIIIYQVIEKPMTNALRRKWDSRRVEQGPATASPSDGSALLARS